MKSNIIQDLSSAGASIPNEKFCTRAKLDTGTLCNYKCYFCYYKKQLNINTPFEIIQKRIDTLYDLGCRDFDLSGGESTVHPDFFKILEYLNKLNVKISCLTNGSTFHNMDYLKKAYDFGLNDILFSLHSVYETHDKMVGKSNAYKKIIKAIENAKQLNILVRFNSTITDINYKLVDNEYFDVVESLNPFEMNFLPLNYFSQNHNSQGLNYEVILEPIKRFIDKSKIKLINVRYVPFCHMVGYEKHVVGYYQHLFDIYDWNLAYYEYKESSIENLKSQAALNRKMSYMKIDACKSCKYFYICDGIEPQVIKNFSESFKPVVGEKIKNVLFYRQNFFSN